MKKYAFLVLALMAGGAQAAHLNLPLTMDSASVQAEIKALLFNKIEAEGEITEPYSAHLTGDYSEVKLQDENYTIRCGEHPAGMLAVQQFYCQVSDSHDGPEVSFLSMPQTMDAASVQAFLKGLLFEKLQAVGPITEPYRASLTGSYGEVTLEDESSKVVCREHSAGMLAVQTFGCDFELKK